jgi:hypothetical protein
MMRKENDSPSESFPFNLFSTSQRIEYQEKRKKYDECLNNAPYFAYQIDGKKWGVVQGCCNDWMCPKCGQQRAREEYGRIVSGAREIAKDTDLYMFTITCRGKDCSIDEAENNYLKWTNNLLTKLRAETISLGKKWYYASVTERQDRLHPHSHFITSYCPTDGIEIKKGERKHFKNLPEGILSKKNTIQSFKLERQCAQSGLGYMYDISKIESIEAGSRYVSKYLFKKTIFSTKWPKGWRRVRYSQSWPKLPDIKGEAIILLSKFDWYKLSKLATVVVTKDDGAKRHAQAQMSGSDTFVM